MDTYSLHEGSAPLLISLPHDSSVIPADLAAHMTPHARRSLDTDWHVGRLYAPLAAELGASVLTAQVSRYVVDLNRPTDGQLLYPGQRETGVVPGMGFDGQPLYAPGEEPDHAEIARRIEAYWNPYHAALLGELQRIKARHGRAILWDGHSIRGHVPVLFAGPLPDFNLGTASGASCDPGLQQRLAQQLATFAGYSHVVNGRFKGGHITRHYGSPAAGIQAIQLELVQATYMDEDNLAYDEAKAARVQQCIGTLLRICLA